MDTSIAPLHKSVGQAAKVLRVLSEAGLSEEAFRYPVDDRRFRSRLAAFWNAKGTGWTTEKSDGREAASGAGVFFPLFADEERESTCSYPPDFAVRSIPEQLLKLAPHFPGLDPEPALKRAKTLPALSSFVTETWAGREVRNCIGWYAVPRWEKVAENYNDATAKVLGILGTTRNFINFFADALDEKHLRQSERTKEMLAFLGTAQKGGDYLLIAAQFGIVHRGRSPRRACAVYAPNEFGLGVFHSASMLLSHPERLDNWEQLVNVDCPGDECAPDAGVRFAHAPYFRFDDGRVRFGAGWFGVARGFSGSASALVPQS